jgi:hypothetical protein
MSNHASNHGGFVRTLESRNHGFFGNACKDAITQAITSITRTSITRPCVPLEHVARDRGGLKEREGTYA